MKYSRMKFLLLFSAAALAAAVFFNGNVFSEGRYSLSTDILPAEKILLSENNMQTEASALQKDPESKADQKDNDTDQSEEAGQKVPEGASEEGIREEKTSEEVSEKGIREEKTSEEVSEKDKQEEKTSEVVAEKDKQEEKTSEEVSEKDNQEEKTSESDSEKDLPKEEKTLADHVRGLRDFSAIEGMNPDVMAGISWDDEIGAVVCDPLQADWDTPGEYTLKYVIASIDTKTLEEKEIKATVYPDLDHYLYGMEGLATVNVGSSFDPMDGITWEDEIKEVVPNTENLNTEKPGEYPVTYELTGKDGHVQTTTRRVHVLEAGAAGWTNTESTSDYSSVIDLGIWRLTAYMDTPWDQGPYVGQTASGAPLIAGRTVAVSAATMARLGLQFGDRLLIDGHIFVIEDHGGYAMNDQNWADIFVDNPGDEYSERFNRYSPVFLLR